MIDTLDLHDAQAAAIVCVSNCSPASCGARNTSKLFDFECTGATTVPADPLGGKSRKSMLAWTVLISQIVTDAGLQLSVHLLAGQ
jgi:hypothetical protein